MSASDLKFRWSLGFASLAPRGLILEFVEKFLSMEGVVNPLSAHPIHSARARVSQF